MKTLSEVTLGLLKIGLMVMVAATVTGSAFLSGYLSSQFSAPIAPAAAAYGPPSVAPAAPATAQEPEEFRIFWEAWNYVEKEFYGELPSNQEMTYGAIRGALQTLGDKHTVFIEPTHAAILNADINGSFEGIGAAVDMDEAGRLIIVEPFEGAPAAQAGLKRGDWIMKVDDTVIENMSIYEAVALIRGPEGTTVRLTVKRAGEKEPFEVSVVRQRIDIPVISSRMLEDDIAYVKLSEFNGHATRQMRETLDDLLPRNPKGLILDLRNNPGGFLQTAIEIGSEFVGQGPIVIEKGKDVPKREYSAIPGGRALDVPLVVLVNGGTASASEIVAGAIQDTGRGILIGEQTLGKGSVQLPHTLSDGSQVRVTIARWLTPKGRAIQDEGLTPDIVVEITEDDVKAGHDPQLERAIEYLLTGE